MKNQFIKQYDYLYTAESLLRKAAKYGVKTEIKHIRSKVKIIVYMDECDFNNMP